MPASSSSPSVRPAVSYTAASAAALFAAAVAATTPAHDARFARADAEMGLSQAARAPVVADEQELVNWSGTHSVHTTRYYQPETLDELKAVVAAAHESGQKLRPVGSALSPNALAFCSDGMVNVALMDSILAIDKDSQQVTVQAGARVSQVVEALRPHGLTLQNYASIAEQQIGGFIQVGAHGTGARLPPVDEQVVGIKLITPGAGEVSLAADDEDPMLFKLARTSLGLLGIVAEVTLQCVPAHSLVERTFVASHAHVRANHASWMRDNRHLRYMWIPHTDVVVVVTCNPVTAETAAEAGQFAPRFSEAERLEPARELLSSLPAHRLTAEDVAGLSFTSLRDELLAVDPLNTAWVKRVNAAEAEYWRRSEGLRVDASDRILGFECGGQQWVSEVAFPVRNAGEHRGKAVDLDFVQSVLKLIEEQNIPAPSPIEQRWTASSASPLSPAGERPEIELAPVYSWVGIIMYLPDSAAGGAKGEAEAASLAETRALITSAFRNYKRACEVTLWDGVHAVEHWAKIETPGDAEELRRLQLRTAQKYPVATFNAIRRLLFDPKGILSNQLTEAILGGGDGDAPRKAGEDG